MLPSQMAVNLPSSVQDPAMSLQQVRQQWRAQCAGGLSDLWVFGYASLIWRPEFEFSEHRQALVAGWHRALRMRSRINRGTPEQPGLVYALVSGGTCRGVVFRIDHHRADAELDRLWQREMVTGVYTPRWLRCQTPSGPVSALGFTLSRRSPSFTGRLSDADMVHILRHARGRFGTTLDYLVRTEQALRQHGMADAESRRLVQLARSQGLL